MKDCIIKLDSEVVMNAQDGKKDIETNACSYLYLINYFLVQE